MIYSASEILSSISCILLVILRSAAPDFFLGFPFPGLPPFVFSVLCLYLSLVLGPFVHFTHMPDDIFLYFFERFVHFLFKGLWHLYKVGFKVTFLCFSYVRLPRTCCSLVAVLWRCQSHCPGFC